MSTGFLLLCTAAYGALVGWVLRVIHEDLRRHPRAVALRDEEAREHEEETVEWVMWCPKCKAQHIDHGEWAVHPHKTHLCAACGNAWQPLPYPTVGVEDTIGEGSR